MLLPCFALGARGHLVVGVLLLIAGIAVTVSSKEVVWYGAILVGVIEIGRGLHALMRRRNIPE